jgi:hypothetical protein
MKRQPEARQRPAKAFPAGDPNSKHKNKNKKFAKNIKSFFVFLHTYSQTRALEFEGREYKQTAAAKKLDKGQKGAKKGRHGKVFRKNKFGKKQE